MGGERGGGGGGGGEDDWLLDRAYPHQDFIRPLLVILEGLVGLGETEQSTGFVVTTP